MISIPVSGPALRRALRTVAVAAIAVASLALTFSWFLLFSKSLAPGRWGFRTAANVVADTDARAHAAGISVGDRIDYWLMPPTDRYGNPQDGLRLPPVGKKVSFVVERAGRKHIAVLTAHATDWSTVLGDLLPWETASQAVYVVLVLLGSALFLVRPTPLTAAFFLFSVPSGVMLMMFYFLPLSGYTALMALNDALAGLGAIGFLLLAFYLDPTRQTRERTVVVASALLFAAIVVPLASSDVFELLRGTRPAWPLAGWVSFLALWLCYAGGFVLLLRLAVKPSTSRIMRLLAVTLATIGSLTILEMTYGATLNPWYLANLPTVGIDRTSMSEFPTIWASTGWQIAFRLPFALAVSYAAIRAVSFGARPWFIQAASYAGLVAVFVAVFLQSILFESSVLWVLTALGSLLAFYVIVREGIADTGPVYSRIVAYIIVALTVVAAFAVVNLAFAPQLPNYPLIAPIEILVAIAIGYWASGLRDLAGSLSLASIDAWRAWAMGYAREEREALTKALGLAERTRRPSIVAEVRAQIAFAAWRNGEDAEFERNTEALDYALDGRSERGLRGFASAAKSTGDDLSFEDGDLPEWRSRAALVVCGRTEDATRAQRSAIDALASADRAGLDSLRVLASIAVAETCPAQRNGALERAHAIARDAGWGALSKSILALRANSRDIGILQSFVDVRLRKTRRSRPTFEISFFNAELCQDGVRVPLSEKQLELLLSVASRRSGISDADLIDELWPEAEGDAARNSLRVCLHGLRKNAGDARIVTRVGKGYVVHPWSDVDLWRLQSLLSACRDSGGREGVEPLREACDALRAGDGRRAMVGEWFYRFEQMLGRKLEEAERVLDRGAARGLRS